MLDSSDRSGPHQTPSAREDVSSLPTAELSPNGASPRPAGTWAPNMPAERGPRVTSGPLSRPRPASGPNRGLVQVALPPRPSSLADTELDPLFLEELALKIAANLGTITGSALAERLKLPLAGVVEHLVAAGTKPRRTVYLAFGYDEEVGGRRGAAHLADLLGSRNVHPELVLDEGGALATGLIPGVSAPVALVGIAEKGYVTVAVTAQAEGGHSSMPPDETAVGMLAAAITRLEHHQMPRAIRGPTAEMFDYLGPEMSFAPRLVMANRWLLGGVLARKFGATPQGNAMLRTTTAPTVVQAGVKENVLPSSARMATSDRVRPSARRV